MRVLIFHGYMLRGTGSNIYNASLAPALARLGHEVHLLCQDREVELEGVEIHNPDIGGLLPVYVKDPYEGFEVKAFPELSDEELDRYLEANVAAVRRSPSGRGHRPGARQPPGHGPGDPRPRRRRPLRGQGPRLRPRVHRQAPPRSLRPLRRGGYERRHGVLVGSRHTAESCGRRFRMSRAFERRPGRPSGVDTERSAAGCGRARGAENGDLAPGPTARGGLRREVHRLEGRGSAHRRLALVRAAHPDVRAEDRGVRGVRGGLRRLSARWTRRPGRRPRGRSARARARGRGEEPLRSSRAFLGDPPAGYLDARGGGRSVEFIGRLEHDEVAACSPGPRRWSCRAPSRRPSGWSRGGRRLRGPADLGRPFRDARGLRQLAEALPPEARGLASFEVAPGAVEAIAAG